MIFVQEIDNVDNFERKIKKIFHYITEYGNNSMEDDFDMEDKTKSQEFIKKVHEGWKIAQDHIVDELIIIEETRGENNDLLKEANINKDKVLIKKYLEENEILDFKERVLRKLADSIAWQILKENHIVRRFCISKNLQAIQPSNLRREKETIDRYNDENPLSFALLSDITSFIQIGDALIIDFSKGCRRYVVELKDGEINKKIRQAVDSFYETGECERYLENFKKENDAKTVKQFERMMKQDLRGERLTDIIKKGKGIDPVGNRLEIPDPIFPTKHFEEYIIKLLSEVDTVGYSLGCIDNCLHIGVYSSSHPDPKGIFKCLMESMNIKYPIYSFRTTLLNQVAFPPFILPMPEEQRFDLVFGRKLILLCLDLDEWMKLGKHFGLDLKWLDRSKSSEVIKKLKPLSDLIKHENRVIHISYGENELYFGGILLTQVYYEFLCIQLVFI